VERDQLRAAEGTGEADQQKRAGAAAEQGIGKTREHGFEVGDEDRLLLRAAAALWHRFRGRLRSFDSICRKLHHFLNHTSRSTRQITYEFAPRPDQAKCL
jgi:hypothetical protein